MTQSSKHIYGDGNYWQATDGRWRAQFYVTDADGKSKPKYLSART